MGTVIGRLGSRSPVNSPRNLYATADEKWVAVSASTEATAGRLLTLAGRPDLVTQPWFKTAAARVKHGDELDEAVAKWCASLTAEEVVNACDEVGAPVSLVYSAAEIVQDEHYLARGSIVSVPDRTLGQVRMPGLPFRLSKTPGSIRWIGPDPGEHNEEVYGALGIPDEEIEQLRQRGVI
jgi:crotonobetainyl-CoA:carnitine CoA-transferase CaiB-like acyl-CoA transferase